MAGGSNGREPPKKKFKLEDVDGPTNNRTSILTSLAAPISPPRRKRSEVEIKSGELRVLVEDKGLDVSIKDEGLNKAHQNAVLSAVPSPFRLTSIHDLPATSNIDTVTLKDLLSDPLISECWEFNYLHDLDFLMDAFDSDVRELVKVHVIHGFWKHDDSAHLQVQASRYPNVWLHSAYMPEMYGTHHTKMIALLRHDSQAQIIIHTANLIPRDWRNMTQAVWRSPLLPLLPPGAPQPPSDPPMGSGHRFKFDFLNYLRAYDWRRIICKPLIEQLIKYDFSEIRGALVGSVPGRHTAELDGKTQWGWRALRHVLNSVSVQQGGLPDVLVQISSIATLGQTNQWLEKTFFKSLSASDSQQSQAPTYKIIFPTADEIRRSLDGYLSGSSIHTKINSPAQIKQLKYLKPLLHHWAGDGVQCTSASVASVQDSGRKRAAPHIKTFIRYSNEAKTEIDWALVTSANLSKQAWGEACNEDGKVRVCSYELGVLVWPALYGDYAKMVPTFKQDMPQIEGYSVNDTKVGSVGYYVLFKFSKIERILKKPTDTRKVLLGFRMPYDLPLVKYAEDESPWCASQPSDVPDWRGDTWPVGI